MDRDTTEARIFQIMALAKRLRTVPESPNCACARRRTALKNEDDKVPPLGSTSSLAEGLSALTAPPVAP